LKAVFGRVYTRYVCARRNDGSLFIYKNNNIEQLNDLYTVVLVYKK